MGVHEGAQSAQKEARGIAREPLQRGARCYGTGVGVGVRRRCISFFLFSWPRGMRNLSSLARIAPISPALEVQSLNPWTNSEVPRYASLIPVVSLDLLQEEYLTCVIYICVHVHTYKHEEGCMCIKENSNFKLYSTATAASI